MGVTREIGKETRHGAPRATRLPVLRAPPHTQHRERSRLRLLTPRRQRILRRQRSRLRRPIRLRRAAGQRRRSPPPRCTPLLLARRRPRSCPSSRRRRAALATRRTALKAAGRERRTPQSCRLAMKGEQLKKLPRKGVDGRRRAKVAFLRPQGTPSVARKKQRKTRKHDFLRLQRLGGTGASRASEQALPVPQRSRPATRIWKLSLGPRKWSSQTCGLFWSRMRKSVQRSLW